MRIKSNQVLFGNTKIQVDKEPVILYTGYTDWKRTFKVLNTSDEVIMSFDMNDIDSQVLATGLYMYYSDSCFNPEFNIDPYEGEGILLDFDLLEIINPLVATRYDISILLETYGAWGQVNINIPSTSINLDYYMIQLNGHNSSLTMSIYHVDKFGNTIQSSTLMTENMEEIFDLMELVNDEINTLVTNFVQNNL